IVLHAGYQRPRAFDQEEESRPQKRLHPPRHRHLSHLSGEGAMSTFPGRFAGKVGVVTGAAQGIGTAVALRLAAEGGAVALVDRSDLVDEVRAEIEAQGGTAVTVT